MSRRRHQGTWSSIPQVLRQQPAFLCLPQKTRLCLYDLKVGFGSCGIEVRFPEALVAEMVEATGLVDADVRVALHELEAADWIRREGNIVWIVEQLRSYPNKTSNDSKHRVNVQDHVDGLPQLAIVSDFREHYADYFVESGAAPARPNPGPKARAKAQKNRPAIVSDTWTVQLAEFWSKRVGPVTPGYVGAKLKEVHAEYSVDRLRLAMEAYIVGRQHEGKDIVFEWFAREIVRWLDATKEPPEIIDGTPNATYDLLTLPAKARAS